MVALVYHTSGPLRLLSLCISDDHTWIFMKITGLGVIIYLRVFEETKLRVMTERIWLELPSRPAAAAVAFWDAGLS